MSRHRNIVPMCLDLGLAAHLLGGMSRRWVKDRCKAGDLKGYILGNKFVVESASINDYLDRNRVRTEAEIISQLSTSRKPSADV
jgi:hypothetical protein